MFFISHRGNLNGINQHEENKPNYIFNALSKNFDVEVDIWFTDGSFFLGHDKPEFSINEEFLSNKKIWFHAKNVEALNQLNIRGLHCFWHQNDDVVLTSKGFLWTYPGKQLTKNSICVLPEISNLPVVDCAGFCSDFILKYYNEFNKSDNF
jgi:hypothetical protein